MVNDFTIDASWVGVYRFESGALTTDSSGNGNTLTNVNTVEENTTDFDEGACSADFENQAAERFVIQNANLSSNFPGKTGYTDLAIRARFRFESLPGTGTFQTICSKWRTDSHYRSWMLLVRNTADVYTIELLIGYNGGASSETIVLYSGSLSISVWYSIGISFDDSEKAYLYTVYKRGTPDTKLSEGSGNTANNMSPDTAMFAIGAYYLNDSAGAAFWDGELDEIAIANSPKTLDDFDAIRLGTYALGGTATQILDGTVSTSLVVSNPGTAITAQKVALTGSVSNSLASSIPGLVVTKSKIELVGINSLSTVTSAIGSVISGITGSKVVEGISSISAVSSSPGACVVKRKIALTGLSSISIVSSVSGSTVIGQKVALIGSNSTSTVIANIGAVAVGSSNSFIGISSTSQVFSNLGVVSTGVTVRGQPSKSSSVSASGALSIGCIFTGTAAIAEVSANVGTAFLGLTLAQPINNTTVTKVTKSLSVNRIIKSFSVNRTTKSFSINKII